MVKIRTSEMQLKAVLSPFFSISRLIRDLRPEATVVCSVEFLHPGFFISGQSEAWIEVSGREQKRGTNTGLGRTRGLLLITTSKASHFRTMLSQTSLRTIPLFADFTSLIYSHLMSAFRGGRPSKAVPFFNSSNRLACFHSLPKSVSFHRLSFNAVTSLFLWSKVFGLR